MAPAGLCILASIATGCGPLDSTEAPATTTPIHPGDICTPPSPASVRIRVEPGFVVVPPCSDPDPAQCPGRSIQVIVDPDFCAPTTVTAVSSDETIVDSPGVGTIDLYQASLSHIVRGKSKSGTATITVSVPRGDGTNAEATLSVDVMEPTPIVCSGSDNVSTPLLGGGDMLSAAGGLAGATIALPQGADKPNENSFIWSVAPFAADIACGADQVPAGYEALGPAVTFGPTDKVLPRELPLSIPINPVLLPEKARWRHMRIAYSGPAFKTPRTIPVADPRVEKVDGQWAVTFKSPRLGTYQAVVRQDAGTKIHRRRLTYRAAIGVSMGGGGTAVFGMRHHDRFDVLAPLGGPVDHTWLLHYIKTNHLGGFRSIPPGTQLADIPQAATPCTTAAECQADEVCLGVLSSPPTAGKCTWMPVPMHPYEHPQVFNAWWYEYPRTGTGGSFSRREYAQIFRDLALMYGNPGGENLSPGGENLPAGVPPDDPSQTGDHPNGECKVPIDPLEGPDKTTQEEIANSCPAERCSHTLTLDSYFDDEYNPDGIFPVITVCDGSSQNEALTPYANTWHADGNNYPLEVGLAVDYNANGVRDEMEPILRAGHEPWDDFGVDQTPSALEPGYAPGVNDDPAGDDYDPQFNPGGTEGDHRRQPEEAFSDTGLDGVMGTKQQPPGGYQNPGDGYDVGEGDGKFTVASGLQRFWDHDPHSIVRRMTTSAPGGDFDDDALARIDLWTDGGTRDLFNFAVDAQHLIGTFAARDRDVAYVTNLTSLPGLDPDTPNDFVPPRVVYEDVQGIVMHRYGKVDPTAADIDSGSGQHVGTGNEIVGRLQSALYFIGSRWQDPDLRTWVEDSADNPVEGASNCEILGNCAFEFTSSSGRTGPVGITLPPGYAHVDQQNRRYPVIYMLHGYGQSPEDLQFAIVVLRSWMNSPTEGIESRLPKAILVYVDGRCRIGPTGKPECLRGTFFADSVRNDGAKQEQWWLELIDYIDQNYRTLGEREVDWTE